MPKVTHLLMAELDQNTGTLRAVQGPFYWSTWLSKCDKMEKPRELSCWSENNFVFTSGIIFHTWNSKHLQTDIIISVLQVEKNRKGERLSIDWLHCRTSGSRKAPPCRRWMNLQIPASNSGTPSSLLLPPTSVFLPHCLLPYQM